jgi:hypothetical protein
MSAGNALPDQAGLKLINKLDGAQKGLARALKDYDKSNRIWTELGYSRWELNNTLEIIRFALHRLRFLEMVVTGLTYMEQHDAQAYARFVESKRNLEDLDFEELREILR